MFGVVFRWDEESDRRLIEGWTVQKLNSVQLGRLLNKTPSQITGRLERLREMGVDLPRRSNRITLSKREKPKEKAGGRQAQIAALARRPPLEAGNELTWGCLNSLLPNVGPLVYNPVP